MNFDLHSHSTYSDGELSPEALVERALEQSLSVFAITDHDATDALADASRHLQSLVASGVARQNQLLLISGVEISSRWRTNNIHIVGLNFDSSNVVLAAFLANQQALRLARNSKIITKLKKLLREAEHPELALALEQLVDRPGATGRPDIAKVLVRLGVVKDMNTAFRQYLADGKAASVSINWPSIEETIAVINQAGGDAVLAHPMHYKMTGSKRRALLADFKAANGSAIEVISGRQDVLRTKELAKLSVQFKLKASVGSDFHGDSMPWQRLGGLPELPKTCEPIWQDWELTT